MSTYTSDIRSTTYEYIPVQRTITLPVTYERAKITAVSFYLVTLVNGNKSMHTEAPPPQYPLLPPLFKNLQYNR